MPDVTITIHAKNLTSSEFQAVQRDLTALRQGFNDTGDASKSFGDRTKTAYKQIERVSGVVNSVTTVAAGFKGVKGAIAALGTAATGPIGIAVAATAALTAGVTALALAQEKAREESKRLAQEHRNAINAIKRDPTLSVGRKALEVDFLSTSREIDRLRKELPKARKEREKRYNPFKNEGKDALLREGRLEDQLDAALKRYRKLKEQRKLTDKELNALRKEELQTQLKTIDAQIKKNQLIKQEYILKEKSGEITARQAFDETAGLSRAITARKEQRVKVIRELKQLTSEEQQIIGETTSSIKTQNTALHEQVLILEARVVALETQLTALQEQKTIVQEQTTALKTQKTISEEQTETYKAIVQEQTTALKTQKTISEEQTETYKDQVYELEKVVVVAHKLSKELRDQVDLEKLINAEKERRKTAETVRFPAHFRQPVEGVTPDPITSLVGGLSKPDGKGFQPQQGVTPDPITSLVGGLSKPSLVGGLSKPDGKGFQPQLGADHPDNQLPTQPTAPRSTKTGFDRGPSAAVQDVPGLDALDFITAVPDPNARTAPIQVPDFGRAQDMIVDTVSSVPVDLLGATYESFITIPQQMQEALSELQEGTKMRTQEIRSSEVLSAREKAKQIEEIERNAAQRRKEIEEEASRAKIEAFNKVVTNFIGGIGRMIAEQVKLKAASAATNFLFGASGQAGAAAGSSGLGGLLGAAVPFLAANPALAIGGGLALGAAALFSESFDDPVNDAMARQAGMRQANTRARQFAKSLGINSAQDLTQEFESGFEDGSAQVENESGVAQQAGDGAVPPIQNHITLRIGEQEMKVLHEETQRNIERGIISS